MISPATSSATHSEFAIPPIVPSQQQQPPHTAHPSSRHHFPPPHSPQYAAFSHLSGRTAEPKTPTHGSLQRQQFMQPFEHLFDTIETTRTLKSTLDDQIRRSSALIQTLQASSTTVEGLIRNQMKELQKEVMHRMEDRLEDMYSRVSSLEKRMVGTTEEQEDNRRSQSTTPSRRLQESLISPPTIVRSQHDIGPQEYHHMLDALRERLDRLERQMES
ncbi:hypothetical protein CU098_000439 [Rhizopus stolonifer]|uniref:Uncharacterized protein n=2 Tax=Mucorineae TaxID=1344963 RepID=A0A367KPS7_RHIST|nr:hypothetical protein CU098_000439 [Rhizopus stolonifer]